MLHPGVYKDILCKHTVSVGINHLKMMQCNEQYSLGVEWGGGWIKENVDLDQDSVILLLLVLYSPNYIKPMLNHIANGRHITKAK